MGDDFTVSWVCNICGFESDCSAEGIVQMLIHAEDSGHVL